MQMISDVRGPVAQWIRRLTTDQEIPYSSPGRVVLDTAITSHGHDYSFPVPITVSFAFVLRSTQQGIVFNFILSLSSRNSVRLSAAVFLNPVRCCSKRILNFL